MADSAQDYTYQVLSVDSGGQATIQMTSYDSLPYYFFHRLEAGDSDGTIASLVKDQEDLATTKWSSERETTPTITIGSPVSSRYKVRSEDTKPIYNFLTSRVYEYDSETTDGIITHFGVLSLTDSEKAETYATLSIVRSDMLQNLFVSGYLSNVESDLSITDVSDDSDEITVKHQSVFEFNEPIMQRIQSSLSLNDSDFAKLFVVQ